MSVVIISLNRREKKKQQEIALAPESRLFSVVGMSRGVGEFFKKQQLNGLKMRCNARYLDCNE